MARRWSVTLYHEASGREVPVEVVTVFGRNDCYYRYTEADRRGDRLDPAAADGLAALNYVHISADGMISRTHGLLDPARPGVRDLNSTNGTTLNGTVVPRREGREGPLVALEDGDRIGLGSQVFRVGVRELESDAAVSEAQGARRGWVAAGATGQARAARIQEFLVARKGLPAKVVLDWPGVISSSYALQQEAAPNGLVVCALVCEVRGESLVLNGEALALDKLLAVIQRIPGRKILALEVEGDPTHCEALFEAAAHEDMILLTSPAEADLARDEVFENTAGTLSIDQLRESVAGGATPGTHDDVLDGLDSLVQADSNILMISWIATYEGRLRVRFGLREDSDDQAISHSLRLGSTTFRF